MGVVVDHLASRSALRGLTYASDEDQRCRADLIDVLENLKLGLQSGFSDFVGLF